MKEKLTLLGGQSPATFLRQYWQKKPLLIRQAIPGLVDPLSIREVQALACRDEAESRLVVKDGKAWRLEHGPFTPKTLRALQAACWTILVQDTQHFSHEAHDLLRGFNFIPHARIDDLMVSYARPGAGVGPHVDSYDVFLLQGQGRRRWRISSQQDLTLVPDAPLKQLKKFKPEQEWVLESGDMLYLPPGYAHDGIAETDCLTWSIGFRAPTNQELALGFLDYLRDQIQLEGQYQDPDLNPTQCPGELASSMVKKMAKSLQAIRWTAGQMEAFLGCYLTEPKPHVYFDPPEISLTPAQLARKLAKQGISLDLKSRLLYRGGQFFMNGEPWVVPHEGTALFHELADERQLPAMAVHGPALQCLHDCYQRGYLVFRT